MKEKKPNFIIAGLGFGDEGKGTITDYLVDKYQITNVIRYNGGSQAAHNVVTPEGLSHTFCQFGSGTFVKETKTFLSSQMLIDPYSILEESFVLKQKGILDAMKYMILDPNCAIITPLHKMQGRIQELDRGKDAFGSTGKGVGQAVKDNESNPEKGFRLKEFFYKTKLKEKLEYHYLTKLANAEEIISIKCCAEAEKLYLYFKKKYDFGKLFHFYHGFANSYSSCIDKKHKYLTNLFNSKFTFLLEGAQGTLLDPEYGFFPYITKTNTMFSHAEKLIVPQKSSGIKPIRIGVLRAYSHRHGKGPLPSESKFLSRKIQEEHNVKNQWQGEFRVGWLDLILCRYAIHVNKYVDSIALTCLDQLNGFSEIKVCTSYKYVGEFEEDLTHFFQIEKIKGEVKIIGINRIMNSTIEDKVKLTNYLFHCLPLEYLKFKGWTENIVLAQNPKDLPKNTKKYLDYLESKDGLNTPISILSVGKKRNQKFIYKEYSKTQQFQF